MPFPLCHVMTAFKPNNISEVHPELAPVPNISITLHEYIFACFAIPENLPAANWAQ